MISINGGFIKLLILIFSIFLSINNTVFAKSKTFLKYNITYLSEKKILAITFENTPSWHTYWKNPGDAGTETQFHFNLKSIKPLSWPVPRTFYEKGNMQAFGYEKSYTFFFSLKNSLLPQVLTGSATYLICEHICIPGKIEFSANLSHENYSFNSQFPISKQKLLGRLNLLPEKSKFPNDIEFLVKKVPNKNKLIFYYSMPSTYFKNDRHNLIYPYPNEYFDYKHELLVTSKNGTIRGKMILDWDGEYTEPVRNLPKNSNFIPPIKLDLLIYNPLIQRYSIITKEIKKFNSKNLKELDAFFLKNQENIKKKDKNKKVEIISLINILFFAFIGGLILNIMPCVLPVISLKLYSLVGSNNKSKLISHNLYYSLGVILTFIALAITISILKSAGNLVGWGFQLQSPTFVFIMLGILFVFALNLFGLFEFKTPGGKKLGNLAIRGGAIGDISTGVIATILSTPCSAPFLGTAVSFAFSGGYLQLYLIFIFIGIGLSFPFLLSALFPSLISFLPRPGEWMNTFKKFLGLSMLITSIWLWDIFLSLTSYSLFLPSAIFISILGFFIFLITHKKIGTLTKLVTLFLLMYSLIYLTRTWSNFAPEVTKNKTTINELSWQKWSIKKMTEYQKSNDNVFLDFTAKWCLTCKVNEKLVFQTTQFKTIVKKYNLKLLLGDWTKRDPEITRFLNKYNFYGVPAYLIIRNGKVLRIGETISNQTIIDLFGIAE